MSFVYFANLPYAGGYHMHATNVLTSLGSRMLNAFVGEVPAVDIGDEFDIPLIFVSRTTWLSDLGTSDSDTVIAGYTVTAAPHTQETSTTIQSGLETKFPNDEPPIVQCYVNGVKIESQLGSTPTKPTTRYWTQKDWMHENATGNLMSLFHFQPVQEYSAPSAFQAPPPKENE